MLLSKGSQLVGLVQLLIALYGSTGRQSNLCDSCEVQYSAVEKTSAMDDVRRVSAEAPHVVPQSLWMILLRVFILAAVFSRCFL